MGNISEVLSTFLTRSEKERERKRKKEREGKRKKEKERSQPMFSLDNVDSRLV